jgi:ABC-type transport system substrate-binding protein
LGLVILLHMAWTLTSTAAPVAAPELRTGNYGGNFRFAVNEPGTLDPADYDYPGSMNGPIIGQVFEGLTKLDDDHSPLPAAAQSWVSSDAQNWTFHIRPGARFHNGRQITAQDVVYSWNRVATAGNEWYDAIVAPLLNTATAVSTATLQVTLNQPFAAFPLLLANPYLSIVPSETVGTIDTNPVGSGPFQFQNWTPGDSVVLSHYDGYYAGRPYLDSITYQFYADQGAMYDDYLLGHLDLSPVPADRIDEVVGNPNAIWGNSISLFSYGMKVDWPPFDDVRVRQALNHAVDKRDIVDNVVAGYEVVAEGPVPPGMQGYDPVVSSYPYSPTLALSLLAQAGWTDTNLDGILDDGVGTDLTIEMWHNTSSVNQAVANAMADDFRDIGSSGLGATVVVSDTDVSIYWNNVDLYPMYRQGWFADYPDPFNFLDPFFRTGAHWNHTHYSNVQVDGWLAQTVSTLDTTARQALYGNIETQVQNDTPFINLYYPGAVYVKEENVVGLVIPSWPGTDVIQMERVQIFFQTHDVELQSVLQPKSTALIMPIAPTAKVRNAGSSAETNVPVRCRILQNSIVLYNQTQTIASLSPFAGKFVAFPAWMPPAAGSYTFEFTTLLPGDGAPSNDQRTQVVAVTDVAFYDAYTKDSPSDYGSVPTSYWWQSPDIIVRNQDDGIHLHQDPILGQTNTVYVQVRNIGNATITDGYVNVYWHEPSAAIVCGDWALINPSPVPVGTLMPGQSTWVKAFWVPTIEGHTCLFSRSWSSHDLVTYECDVPWDNNIAQRNVEVVELGGGGLRALAQTGQASVVFEVTNVRDLPAAVDLIVERGTFPMTGTLELEFSQDLFSRWQTAGGTVVGGAVVPGTTRIAVTHPVSTTVVGLPLGVREAQQVRMHLTGPPAAEFALYVSERIEGDIVGGMSYRTEIQWTLYLPLAMRNY